METSWKKPVVFFIQSLPHSQGALPLSSPALNFPYTSTAFLITRLLAVSSSSSSEELLLTKFTRFCTTDQDAADLLWKDPTCPSQLSRFYCLLWGCTRWLRNTGLETICVPELFRLILEVDQNLVSTHTVSPIAKELRTLRSWLCWCSEVACFAFYQRLLHLHQVLHPIRHLYALCSFKLAPRLLPKARQCQRDITLVWDPRSCDRGTETLASPPSISLLVQVVRAGMAAGQKPAMKNCAIPVHQLSALRSARG